jgi:hypothetical protein
VLRDGGRMGAHANGRWRVARGRQAGRQAGRPREAERGREAEAER